MAETLDLRRQVHLLIDRGRPVLDLTRQEPRQAVGLRPLDVRGPHLRRLIAEEQVPIVGLDRAHQRPLSEPGPLEPVLRVVSPAGGGSGEGAGSCCGGRRGEYPVAALQAPGGTSGLRAGIRHERSAVVAAGGGERRRGHGSGNPQSWNEAGLCRAEWRTRRLPSAEMAPNRPGSNDTFSPTSESRARPHNLCDWRMN